ncbi:MULTISPECIES: TetR/AcrR family transcriptional regulator [unclassified Variovorax]|uniref:TetR/AcrR family transcriptional regulator n=1 Tax=unclassified Variovorax TaxID=663243 RepID=UPI0008BBC713|nr:MULTISPECIES: TetR/AcrR family transcriptional regulator [unclassified Variovorax]SEJ14223.1 transcriptional regulator, TetR family [Variovorax sp. OK202]SFC04683.1 transcriptional regulator, TetR family [Variovorax sp. OK212]
MDISTLPARERILLTAHDLFYADGIRATGVDRVIAASGVTKVTFYRHFPSKDDLVRAFLEHRHGLWMAWFVDALGRRGAQQRIGDAQALPVLADAMAEWFSDPVFRGCAFINSVVEVGASVAGASDIAREHKREMVEVIAGLLPERLDGPRRMAIAQAAGLGVDGAIVKAQMGGAQAQEAVDDLRRLLQALGAALSA